MRRLRRALCLAAVLSAPGVQGQDAPLFTTDLPREEFAARRDRVLDAIGKEAMALVQGAPSPTGYVRFRQTNEFYYLTGIEVPHAYLLLDGSQRRAALYLPHRNEHRERFEGKVLSAEDGEVVKGLAGLPVHPLEALGEHLARSLTWRGNIRTLYTPLAPAEGAATSRDLAARAVADWAADPWDGRPAREAVLASWLRSRLPAFELKDLSPTLDRHRLLKSPREIALIKTATRLACLGILEAMRSTEPGIFEHELDAVARYVFHRNGAQGDAYYSLIASGPNALYPHYNAGKRRMKSGELVLMDYAPDYGYAMSDVTRVWPVGGRFSPEQRELYSFYVACYRALLAAVRPGVTHTAIKQEAAVAMEKILAGTRFSKPSHGRGAAEFVRTFKASASTGRLGHWVGMATHDVGDDDGPLRAGMVFTIEPPLQVPEDQIYIRLEDLVVITDKGAEVVSDWLPIDPDAIERVMREEGMLQKYPRDAPGER